MAEGKAGTSAPPSAAQVADDLFDKIDVNHDGSLCVAEVGAALRAARLPTCGSDVAALFRRMDADGDGSVSREEFAAFVARRRANLRAAFDGICGLGGGERQQWQRSGSKRQHFTAGSLRAAAAAAHLTLSDTDVRLIMQRMDANGDNVVTFDEFVSCMLLVPAVNPRAFFDSWFVDCFCDDALSEYTVPRELRAPVRPMLVPAPLATQPSPAPSSSSSTAPPAASAAPRQEEGEGVDAEAAEPSFAAMVAKKLACGGVAGIVSRTATAPIDRVRLRMMASATPLPMLAACRSAISGGARALWTGNGVNCLKIGPEMGIKLLSFDLLRKALASDPDNVTAGERFAAGGAAGALSQAAIYPLEVLRTRLVTAAAGQYPGGVRHCARELWRSGGVRAFYAGLSPSVLGIVPYAAIDLTLNSMLRECAASRLDARGEEVSVPLLLGCGMASSTAATVATFPLNVVRTKAQATGAPLREIVKEMRKDGPRSLCRGFTPCMVKVLPATSISYTVYECLGRQWGS